MIVNFIFPKPVSNFPADGVDLWGHEPKITNNIEFSFFNGSSG